MQGFPQAALFPLLCTAAGTLCPALHKHLPLLQREPLLARIGELTPGQQLQCLSIQHLDAATSPNPSELCMEMLSLARTVCGC